MSRGNGARRTGADASSPVGWESIYAKNLDCSLVRREPPAAEVRLGSTSQLVEEHSKNRVLKPLQ